MNMNFRLIFSGVVFLALTLFIGFRWSWEYGFITGVLTALLILYVTSDAFKEMQRRQAEMRRRQQLLRAEDEAIRHEEAQRERGRLEGRQEHAQQKAEAIRMEKMRNQRLKSQRELYNKTKRYYDRMNGPI